MNTNKCCTWHPLVPSAQLRAGRDIVAAWAQETELAMWRSAGGTAQAWENRCPHRSVRFTLGQVAGDRLRCAYHGWEYMAESGQCAAIPAHPTMAAPRNVCARTYHVTEADGMVWVHLGTDAPETAPADAMPVGWRHCRSLAIRTSAGRVAAALSAAGWRQQAQAWTGELGGVTTRAHVLDAQEALAVLHLWTDVAPGSREMTRLHSAARNLRGEIELAAL